MASVLLTWTPADNITGTDQIVQYRKSTDIIWTNYSTISTTANSQLISSLLDNVIYNFRVISDCNHAGPVYSTITSIVNLVCPSVVITPTTSTITYSFSYPSSTSITGYIVELWNSNSTVLISTQNPTLTSTITGTFSGLPFSTNYTLRITILAGTFSNICPLYSTSTGSGITYNYTRTGDFQKNNCPASPISIGSTVTYSQIYTSYISTGDAQAIALADTTFPTSGQTYANSNGSCSAVPSPTATGILVVDFFSDHTLNLIGYCNTSGTAPYQQPVYAGNNFYPNDGTPVSNCWALASDIVPGPPVVRFEFNIARLLVNYPLVTSFVFLIQGRNSTGGTISGSYNMRGASSGTMIMTGSPGSYIPSETGGSSLGVVSFGGISIPSGANGTYGLGVGSVIMTFTYNVTTKVMTQT